MRIVIAGAGSVGRTVALELIDHGHDVTLIDNHPDQIRVASVADADWILADACSPETLAEAGVAEAEVLVATTGDDKANLVISLLAKTEFAVPRVVARVNNPKNQWLFDGSWGVDVLVSTPKIMTALVEEAITVGVPVEIFEFSQSQVAMFALVLPEDSPAVGRTLGDLNFPVGVVVSAVIRQKRPISIGSDDVLEAGDELILLVPESDRDLLNVVTSFLSGSRQQV